MLQDLLSSIDPTTMILGLLFIIFFVFIQFALSKTMKDKSSSGIIAFCVSLLAVYGLSRTNFDITSIFYNIGIDDNIIYTVLPIVILVGLIYLFWKVKLRFIFTILGIGLIVGSFFVYQQTLIFIIGIVVLLAGLYLMYKESRRKVDKGYYIRH